ncbi:hypothetical protein B0H14DRAFT_2945400 [Mycena olivaceomarginata]|nr:hypothetical protein B0H14DRAFT_2945400 [Mycena olivaceomarginata]
MAAESLLIAPNGPTLLNGVSELPIDALDVPELIDMPRFTAVLAKTLVLFPLYAARVRCAEGGGVPWVHSAHIASSSETSLVPIEAVVQKPLRFLPSLSPRNIVLDPSAPLATILLNTLSQARPQLYRCNALAPDRKRLRRESVYARVSKNYWPEPVYKAARASLHGVDTHAAETYYPITATHPQLDPAKPANIRLDRLSLAQLQQLRDYYAYAFAVRSLARAREPAFLSALLDLQATRATEAAARGEVMDLASPPGHMLTGRSYVGTVPFVRHLKLARPNPAVSADGTWRERLDEAEVTLFFQPAERERFMQEINERAKALGIEGGVEWVERS